MPGYFLASAASSCLLSFLFGSYQGTKLSGPSAELAERLEILVLVPARPHAEHAHRRPALLDQLARQQDRVVEAADHQQRVGAGGLGLGHLDRKIARGRIVGDRLVDLVGHVELRHHRADALLHRRAERVVDMQEHHRLRRRCRRPRRSPSDWRRRRRGSSARSGSCGTRTCSPAR